MVTLEERINKGDFPECPVYTLMIGRYAKIERLDIYGVKSNNCSKCNTADVKCELYLDWLGKKFLEEKR